MENHQDTHSIWWGEMPFDIGQSRAWRLGSLEARLTRGVHEWQFSTHRPRRQDEDQHDWVHLDSETPLTEPVQHERYLFARTGPEFILMPRLADRPVIVKPMKPIHIAAGQQGTLFVSTPLWMVGMVKDQREPLFDVPILQPKESWFGPNTLKGDLCYATPVHGRIHLADLPPRAFRAVTPVHFHNTSNSHMPLLRMNLPVPALPLFYSPKQNRLWTSQIDVIQEAPGRPPRIRIDFHTPPQAGAVQFLSPARVAGGFARMFDSFFD